MKFRIRSINQQNRELENRVNGRTKELQDAQERLRLANHELKKQLEEITNLEKQVREQAIRDALTGLYNRHHLSDVLESEFSLAERKRYAIAFMLIDLDHFKQVNDNYGHHAGDLALKAATQVISKHIRINASIGVAIYPQHGDDSDEILMRVDKALYEAKKTGRNKVILYASGIEC